MKRKERNMKKARSSLDCVLGLCQGPCTSQPLPFLRPLLDSTSQDATQARVQGPSSFTVRHCAPSSVSSLLPSMPCQTDSFCLAASLHEALSSTQTGFTCGSFCLCT